MMNRKLNPRNFTLRDIDWPRTWELTLTYIGDKLGKEDELNNLDPYLIEAVEKHGNQECREILLLLAIETFRHGMSTSERFDRPAAEYVFEGLCQIYEGKEPNKVFGWNKATLGPNRNPEHEELLNVVIPEYQRRERKKEIQNRLKMKSLLRSEKDTLNGELSAIKPPSHIKRNTSENDGDCEYYSYTRVRQLMKKHKATLDALLATRKRLTLKLEE